MSPGRTSLTPSQHGGPHLLLSPWLPPCSPEHPPPAAYSAFSCSLILCPHYHKTLFCSPWPPAPRAVGAVRGTAGTGSQGCLDPEVLVPSPWRKQETWDPDHRCREDPSKGTRDQGEKEAKTGRALDSSFAEWMVKSSVGHWLIFSLRSGWKFLLLREGSWPRGLKDLAICPQGTAIPAASEPGWQSTLSCLILPQPGRPGSVKATKNGVPFSLFGKA